MKKGFLSGASLYADGSSEADPSLWRSKGRAPVLSLRTTAAAYEVHGAFNEARQYLGKEDFEVTRSGATVRVRGKPDDPMSLIAGLDESVEVPLDGDFSKMSADFSEYQLRITIPRSPELAAMPPELLRLLHQVAKAEEAGEPVPPELLQQLQALSTAGGAPQAAAAEAAEAEAEGSYLPPEAYRLLLNCAAGGGVAASAVSVDFGPAHARRPHATDARIDERWAAAREGNARLFDGSKFRLRRVSGGGADGAPPHLELGLTGYREYVGTHLVDAAERRALEDDGERDHGERGAHMANALGCEAVLVTSDGHAVLLRRSGEVATHGGLYNGPSGHPEPSRAVVEGDDKETRAVEAAARVRNELYASVLMETHEEVGVPLEKLKAPTLLGVMADPTGKPDLLFLVRTDLDAAAVRECYAAGAEEGWESDRLATWPVADLAACTLPLTPVTRAAIYCATSAGGPLSEEP